MQDQIHPIAYIWIDEQLLTTCTPYITCRNAYLEIKGEIVLHRKDEELVCGGTLKYLAQL